MSIHDQRYNDSSRPGDFYIQLLPPLRFILIGKGNDVSTFARLTNALGYEQLVCSPDETELAEFTRDGLSTIHLSSAHWPPGLTSDSRTAILLFFHDHEWEPPILRQVLIEASHFVGAQGSQRTAQTRIAALNEMDPDLDVSRLSGPIGLIPSTRDAHTLTVSVLAEVLAAERKRRLELHNLVPAMAS